MTVARSAADVLDDHVVFEVESIDRMYLNVWQPRLAYRGGVQGFFVGHRGHHYASTALMDPMTKTFVADIHGFVAARGLELVHFAKGPAQRRAHRAVSGRGRLRIHRRMAANRSLIVDVGTDGPYEGRPPLDRATPGSPQLHDRTSTGPRPCADASPLRVPRRDGSSLG